MVIRKNKQQLHTTESHRPVWNQKGETKKYKNSYRYMDTGQYSNLEKRTFSSLPYLPNIRLNALYSFSIPERMIKILE